MGTIYVDDAAAVRLRQKAKAESRSISGTINILLDQDVIRVNRIKALSEKEQIKYSKKEQNR